MNLWKLIQKSLVFNWRINVGVLMGVAISSAVLVGALVVGDSVRGSLAKGVEVRLGEVELALSGRDRFFRSELADTLGDDLNAEVAPVLQLRGLITNDDGSLRVNNADILGVDDRFYKVGPEGEPFGEGSKSGVVLNRSIASRLGVNVGDEVFVRLAKPGLMPRDIPLTPDSDLSVAKRLRVTAVAGDEQFGSFGLQANQVAPFNAFVDIAELGEMITQPNKANLLLVAGDVTPDRAAVSLKDSFTLEDASLSFSREGEDGPLELTSSRVLIDDVLADAALTAGNAAGILTYFVNEISTGENTTPYSFVAAMDEQLLGEELADGEVIINSWLASDLGVKAGDEISMKYFVVDAGRKLIEQVSRFKVKRVTPIAGKFADKTLMPDFPGLAGAENCRDWDPGIPIDLDKIRDKDERYWDDFTGTPKAFIALAAGQKIWSSRYGSLTAIRFSNSINKQEIESKILESISPASLGFYFRPVREMGVKASGEGTDFGGLFIGLSMFLIAAAVIMTAMVFVFGIESRVEQTGTLRAVGWSKGLLWRLYLAEGAVLAIVGAVIGGALGLLYTKAMIWGLSTLWQGAVAGSAIDFYCNGATVFGGMAGAVAMCMFAICVTLRKQLVRPAKDLLAGNFAGQILASIKLRGKGGFVLATVCVVAAVALLVFVGADNATGAFFGVGTLLLIGVIAFSYAVLLRAGGKRAGGVDSLWSLSLRNGSRRAGRSLAVISVLACGVFLVVAVGANRHDPRIEASKRDSGTGGFALIGETSIGVLHDLDTTDGRRAIGIGDADAQGMRVVSMRVRDGDDASCLNLNRAQQPRVLGVDPEELSSRGAFKFVKGGDDGWDALNTQLPDGQVAAVGDYATLVWALGKKIGDMVEYTDDTGKTFNVKIVGMIQDSILQGSLLIAENNFRERFPSEEGFRMFLIDAEPQAAATVSKTLSRSLRDFGFEIVPTSDKLAAFLQVQNTYLDIFQMLGGLGLILGSAGLGVVVLRNVLDRRGELAMMRAVGFDRAAIKKMILAEHCLLLIWGLIAGVVTALIAVTPAIKQPAAEIPFGSLTAIVMIIAAVGALWVAISANIATRGNLIEVLRNE